jgi:hypothetical protein
VEIRRLRASDDRARFQSGDPDLDRFFRSYAGQNQFRRHIGVTYVAVEAGEVLGYLTVAPGAEAFYERYGFRAIDVVEGHSDARPRPTPMFLPTSETLAATPRRSKRQGTHEAGYG